MEGYSVTEAASILGVPIERVWELLARGVLAGQPEGETGMRVFLQPRPAPAPAPPDRPNGNGGPAASEPEREPSPFRELLTEFRNLTERYGQALLALGEARGETAALRSRVDLLEARMDLRLPMTSPGAAAAAGSWPMPPVDREARSVSPSPRPTVTEGDASHDAGEDHDDERPARRRRSHRRATENFAEALARAEDPTRPELPGAQDAAAALAALREDVEHATVADAALPRELPAADAIPLADEETGPGAVEAVAQPPAAPDLPVAPEPVADDPSPEAAPEPSTEAAGPPAPVADEAPTPVPTADVAQAPSPPVPSAEPATDVPPLAIPWDPDRYTVEIAEPDWIADDGDPPEAAAAPAPEAPPAGERELPASPQLEDALAALDAIAGRRPATPEPSPDAAPSAEPTGEPETTAPPESPPAAPTGEVSRSAPPLPTPPTSRAYRRLRRIFPG